MKVVILAGGFGTRISEESHLKPKPMIEIGEKPILLLDDFMSELDEKRRNHFLEKIEKTQVIITCTDKIDIENKNILIYNVKEGKVIRGGN